VYQVRKLIAELMCPPEPIMHHLISPDLPSALLGPIRLKAGVVPRWAEAEAELRGH
jgi:hypothetical protein